MFKKIISSILAIAMLASIGTTVFANESGVESVDYNMLTDNQKLVYDYWDVINDGDWSEWADSYAPAVSNTYFDFATNTENQNNNLGILTVSSAKVVDIVRVDNYNAPRYPELQSYYESESAYECYVAIVDLNVKENNGYFTDGQSKHLITLVNDGGNWGIGGMSGCPDNFFTRGNGRGFNDFIDEPSTILVKDETGYVNKSGVSFDSVVFNATCNEIGNKGYNAEAIKANVMAVKMCAWWAKAGEYRETEGCDIKYGDIAYKSKNDATATNQKTIQSAIDAVDGMYIVSDSKTGGKLFYTSYFAGTASDTGKATGQLRQNGSNYLATNASYKYDWKKIIHYYFDNSKYNNDTSVGIVQIK